jgi:hypothetical protein
LKHFEGGGAIDLLAEFGDEIFSYKAGDERVKLNATIIIIDGSLPENEPDVRRYYANGKYGVKLAEAADGTKCLYIWDGEPDGIASDPLALAAKKDGGTPPSGGGGCNAGFGLLGLLLAGLVMCKPRKA